MRPTPEKIKLEILNLYLNGYSIREIAHTCKVSLGTVSNSLEICQSEKKELEELREIQSPSQK
jgi:transposase-like protein